MKHTTSRTVPTTGSSGVGNAISDITVKMRKASRAAREAGKTARTGRTATIVDSVATQLSWAPWITATAIKTARAIDSTTACREPTISSVGFVSHVQGDLKMKAQEAGCDVVMPRSAFSQNLPSILRRHGAEDEPDVNFNKV